MALSLHGKAGGNLYRPLAEINVIPLVDVMLVLLIIFIMTAPMLATGLKVELPQAKQAQPLNPKEPVVITVAKDGKVSLGGEEIDKDQLIEAVRGKLQGDAQATIHLRGDKQAPYGDVVEIMDLLAANGLTRIAIVANAHAKADAGQAAAAFPRSASASSVPVIPAETPGAEASPK
jgi:biopolymer transport protein TolR